MNTGLVDALGWTLLHSLWQGVVIASLLAVSLVAMKHCSARARYLTAAGSLLALTLCFFITLAGHLSVPVEAVGTLPALLEQSETVNRLLTNHMDTLVVLWLTGACVFAVRFLGGYGYTRQLSRRHARFLSEAWQKRTARLACRLGIRRTIVLAESALVQVPMVIGHLKPMIILPLGLLSQLSRQELEAVLLHELGHIARADYLFNMIQSLVEVLFFYHPAVWWITNRMRAEREHCCDDLAVAVTRDPVTFARALARLAELSLNPAPTPAVAAVGNGSLMFRIRRLVEQDRLPGFSERLVASLLVLGGLLAVGFLSAGPGRSSEPIPVQEETAVLELAVSMVEMEIRAEAEILPADERKRRDLAFKEATAHLYREMEQNLAEKRKALRLELEKLEKERRQLELESHGLRMEMRGRLQRLSAQERAETAAVRADLARLEREEHLRALREREIASRRR
ncbi:MAG: M56 family metallopeptidase [Acidobacteriota bacterium]|nr:M56 family metallopeptidase [Acidobacteriota bacterium]